MTAERNIAAPACGIVALLQDVFGFRCTASFVAWCVEFFAYLTKLLSGTLIWPTSLDFCHWSRICVFLEDLA